MNPLDASEKLPLALVEILNPVYENYVKALEAKQNPPSCQEQFLPQIEHSRIVDILNAAGQSQSSMSDSLPIGIRVIFACDEGFHMNGECVAECNANGQWVTQKEGVCLRKCNAPSIPRDMNLENSTNNVFIVGHRAKLNCSGGLTMKGQPYIECLPTGMWTNVTMKIIIEKIQ
uniref:Sushi domain-containing protein n=1 Tax=Lutzomyia longipalpis TaxID=7200 RepID=A0A1B0CMR3_LUTLO